MGVSAGWRLLLGRGCWVEDGGQHGTVNALGNGSRWTIRVDDSVSAIMHHVRCWPVVVEYAEGGAGLSQGLSNVRIIDGLSGPIDNFAPASIPEIRVSGLHDATRHGFYDRVLSGHGWPPKWAQEEG